MELRPLNVLIGPNGSGKSNFIEAISLLQAAPKELVEPVRYGGGIGAWIWKGEPGAEAEIEAVLAFGESDPGIWNLRHRMAFKESAQRLELVDERIENEHATPPKTKPYFYFGYENGWPTLNVKDVTRRLRREDVDPQRSILAQRKDPDVHPELALVSGAYDGIRLYREWSFGRSAPPRRPQPADQPINRLNEDSTNLALILNKYRNDVPTKRALLEHLKKIFDGVTDFTVHVEGGTVQLFLEEERWTIPATRLSDGTVRWLMLLAVLLDPKPPRLVCIEEPELGLHSDLMNPLADLLKSASERMQLVITTHSEALVDALQKTPEDVLVCERHDGSTIMRRLDSAQLSEWLQDYSGQDKG